MIMWTDSKEGKGGWEGHNHYNDNESVFLQKNMVCSYKYLRSDKVQARMN